jgi:hypothetical protein
VPCRSAAVISRREHTGPRTDAISAPVVGLSVGPLEAAIELDRLALAVADGVAAAAVVAVVVDGGHGEAGPTTKSTLLWAGSEFTLTVISTHGFVVLPVRWQTVTLELEPAALVEGAVPVEAVALLVGAGRFA